MDMEPGVWGKHLVLDCGQCIHKRIIDPVNIAWFAKELVRRIDMVAFGEPQVVYFGNDDKTGYTLVQLIETSNIIGHFNDKDDTAFIDVFSCKDFSTNEVVQCVEEFFGPALISRRLLYREVQMIK
jgi:S-adenosylmethionine decarboxylase